MELILQEQDIEAIANTPWEIQNKESEFEITLQYEPSNDADDKILKIYEFLLSDFIPS